MKIAVIYNSLTGNTEKLAKGVFENIPERYEKALFELKEDFNIDDYDTVVAAFWVDKSAPNGSMKTFISELKNKKVFLLGTMGFFPDSPYGRDTVENSIKLVDESCKLLGYFICNGKINLEVLKKLGQMMAAKGKGNISSVHALDEKNLVRYRVLGEHTNDLDVQYASARVNERLLIEEELEKLN